MINDSENNQNFYKRNILQKPKQNYITHKTDVYRVDHIWSLDILDLKDFAPEDTRG